LQLRGVSAEALCEAIHKRFLRGAHPDRYGPARHIGNVAAETSCAPFHKPLPRKHAADRAELQGKAGDLGHACVVSRQPLTRPGEDGGCRGGLSRTATRVFAALRKEAFVRYVVTCHAGHDGAVLHETSGRIHSPALVRATGRQSRPA
jgi:hypothetical protein